MNKPYAEACDRNREPILSVLKPLIKDSRTVLEIGSGTGQHAVYFAKHMTHLVWQCSDLVENLPGIESWVGDSGLPNLNPPIELDVAAYNWGHLKYDVIFSANVVHIMSWDHVQDFIIGAAKSLGNAGLLVFYGPFNYEGNYTSDTNRAFDGWLKGRDPTSGIRNFEDIDRLASVAGLKLLGDIEMPANNRILYWQRQIDDNL
jgi:cyclopropane fatty-acyl-phospholipid synthase-like methyltransferase